MSKREYKSVVFWLIFVSLYIVGFDLRCNKENDNKKENENTNGNNELNNLTHNNGNINNNIGLNNNNNGFSNQNTNKKRNNGTNANNNNINNPIKPKEDVIKVAKKIRPRKNNQHAIANTGSNSNMNNNNGNMNRILFQNQKNQVYPQNQNLNINQNKIVNKVQNMNPNQINNPVYNNKKPAQANMVSGLNQNMNINNPQMNVNMNSFPTQNNKMPMMNNFVQNNNNLVYPKNQNQNPNQISYQGQIINPNPIKNQINNNNNQLVPTNIGYSPNMVQNMNMNNPQINVNMNSFRQNIPMMNNPMQNKIINNNQMMNNFVQNNNNNLGFSPNPNQNFINILPPPQVPKKLEPISTYPKPTLIGLNNIGSTCYKNAVLQCLSQTKDLTNYFLNEDNYNKIINNNIAKKNPGTKTLCPIYYNLLKNLWKKDATFKSFSPDEFMKSIEEMTKNDQVQFSLYEAGDAKDFIIYILERMHNELKQPVKNKIGKLGPNDKLNQYDKNNAFLFFLDDFQNDTSLLSDLFYGFNETTNVCQFCKDKYNSNGLIEPICYNYGMFNNLIFPLNEVRDYREKIKMTNNTNNNLLQMGNVVNLFECFLYNQKSDYFTGENKNYCNICRQLYDSVYTSTIFVSPNILVLILNRGKGNVFNIKVDFSLQIDITDFVLTKSQNREIYNLYGVITHLGQSGPNAHFVAACKSPVDGNWYRYNDAIVTQINNFQNDIYNFGTPYILFYEKQNK